jgi:hypothetical protein
VFQNLIAYLLFFDTRFAKSFKIKLLKQKFISSNEFLDLVIFCDKALKLCEKLTLAIGNYKTEKFINLINKK